MSEETHTEPAGQPAAPAAVTDATPKANATPAPTETPQEGSAPAEPTPAEVAAKVRDEYTLKEEEENPESAKEEVQPEGGEPEKPYALEFSEGTTIDDGLVGIATKHFKELGADGKAAGACMERIINEYQEAFYEQMAKNDAELKVEWGAEYASRKLEVEQHMRAFCNKMNYPLSRMRALSSPDGYRLYWEIMDSAGLTNRQAAGLGRSTPADDVAWFKRASTPGTAEYNALKNTSDKKTWIANNNKYNRIQQEMNAMR